MWAGSGTASLETWRSASTQEKYHPKVPRSPLYYITFSLENEIPAPTVFFKTNAIIIGTNKN